MMERVFHEKQTALERQSFKYLDIFEQQMREHKQAQREFYETQAEEDMENDKNKPAFFREHKNQINGNEPKSSDKAFDSVAEEMQGGRRLSKKAEDVKAWQNL